MGQLPMNHDDLGTHDECSSGQFVQRPEWLGALQQQHQMHRLSRQMVCDMLARGLDRLEIS